MQRLLPMLFLLVLVAACAGIKKPQVLDPQYAARNIRQIALAPVVFADEPLDRHFGVLAADEIRRQARRTLEKKGYEVALMAAAGNDYAGPPMVASGTPPARMAPAVPPGADTVMLIRIDHFLDAGLTDTRGRIPLDIYATATLMAVDNRILWQGEGRGQGVWFGSQAGSDDYLLAADALADSLFATLPPP